MKVTTELTGNRTKVVVEESGNQANAIRTAELTVDGSGLLSYSAFEGKSIGFIKQYFKGEIDGDNIIGRDATTLDSDGVLDLGQVYAGQTVYLTQLGETFYTSDAKEYADQAEASADNAATSAVDAQTAQTGAETAETNAAASASAASTSETNAANSASAAATSETNAASSASAASASETSAANSASAASTSETNAANSASAAATSETNAATSATEAEAARDEITDKFSFTGNENDLYQIDASGVGQPVSRENLGKQNQIFQNSFLSALHPTDLVYAWDSFNRPDNTEGLGTADSGHTWTNLENGMKIENKIARPKINGAFNSAKIDTGFGSVKLSGKITLESTGDSVYVGIGKDSSNYFTAVLTLARIEIKKTISGVTTSLGIETINPNLLCRAGQDRLVTYELTLYHRGRFDESYITFYLKEVNTYIQVSVTSENSVFATNADVAFALIGSDSTNAGIKSILIEKVEI